MMLEEIPKSPHFLRYWTLLSGRMYRQGMKGNTGRAHMFSTVRGQHQKPGWIAVLLATFVVIWLIANSAQDLHRSLVVASGYAKTPASICTLEGVANIQDLKPGKAFQAQVTGSCGTVSFPPGAIVESTLYVKGAVVSRQQSFLCDADCSTKPTQQGPRSCSSLHAHITVDRLCPRIYVPRSTPLRPPLPPVPNELWEGNFRNLTDYCNQFIWTDGWLGGAASSVDSWKRIYKDMVAAFTSLPLPFTILESGNFCGASTCFMAATKRLYCPDCPFLSVDPGFSRQEDGSIDPQCVEKNIAYAKLSEYVTILDNTAGEEAPLRGPVGYVFNDDGKVHEIVSVQHPLWEPFLMDGARLGYHDYWDDADSRASHNNKTVQDHRQLQSKWEHPKMHRTWMADLTDTPDYRTTFRPPFIAELEERPSNDNWLYDVGTVQKVVRGGGSGSNKVAPLYKIVVTVREQPVL